MGRCCGWRTELTQNPRFAAFLVHMQELHDKKNHDYAEDTNPYSNFEFAARFAGVPVHTVFDVLIGVKQARLLVLRTGKTPNNESLWDTVRDRAVYASLQASYEAPEQPTQEQRYSDKGLYFQNGRLWCVGCKIMVTTTWEPGNPPSCPKCSSTMELSEGDSRFDR